MNAFVLPADAEGGGEAALVITRDSSQPSLALHQYADQQLVEAAKRFPDFKLLGRRSILVDGDPAVEATCTWTAPGGIAVRQRQAIIKIDSMFLNFTLSFKGKESPRADDAWVTVLQSIRRRDV